MSLRRLWAIARKEAIQLRRDPRSLLLAFLLPLLLTLVFGSAISLDVREIPFSVVDHDRSAASRELVEAFVASGYFVLHDRPHRSSEADRLLRRGHARLVLVVPLGYAADLAAGAATVQALVDGADANTATIVLAYADAITTGLGARLRPVHRAGAVALRAETRVWYNEPLESARMVVPGLIAVIMSLVAAMLTALTIAREWERGTMEQLIATPVHRLEVLFGKLVPYVAIGVFDVVLVTAVGLLVFKIPLHGSPVLLALLSLLFIIGVLSFGLFLSARLRSQLLATQVALMATYMPAFLLSGLVFAIAAMPLALRLVSTLVPSRYFVVITRGVFLKGVGLEVLWPQALGLLVFTGVAMGLAYQAFRKELA
jgi:ABC-2 type transport system permease protein